MIVFVEAEKKIEGFLQRFGTMQKLGIALEDQGPVQDTVDRLDIDLGEPVVASVPAADAELFLAEPPDW